MAEETATPGKKTSAAAKKTASKSAAKKSTSKTRTTTASKAKVTPAKKATVAKKTSSGTKKAPATSKPSASKPTSKTAAKAAGAAPSKVDPATDNRKAAENASEASQNAETHSDKTTYEDARDQAQHDEPNFDGAKVIEDLKGRDWGQIVSRALLMFFFGVLGTFALYLAFFLALTQVVFSIFAGEPHQKLTGIMLQLGGYVKDVIAYLSFASDDLPFPFGKDIPPAQGN